MSSWKDHEIRKKSYLNYTQFVSGMPWSQWFGPVSPGRPGSDTQNMTDPASENRFGWFLTGVAWYSLVKLIHYGDVPLDRVYGLSPLCPKGYMISWEFVNRVFPARLIWFTGWILFVLQVHKSNDYNVPQDCVHFVLCPKQANKIEGVVVNRVCILGSFFLNMGSVKPSAAHLYPNIGRLPTHGFVVLVTTVIAPIVP